MAQVRTQGLLQRQGYCTSPAPRLACSELSLLTTLQHPGLSRLYFNMSFDPATADTSAALRRVDALLLVMPVTVAACMQASHKSSSDEHLPVEVLAEVLQRIYQRDRLRCCALVSKAWRQAANMATSTVKHIAAWEEGFDKLSTWLQKNKYTNEIQNIQIDLTTSDSYKRRRVLQLPCEDLQQLRSLKLPRCQLTTATSTAIHTDCATTALAGTPKSFAALTSLSKLELDDTLLNLSELSSCAGLQHLVLCNAGPKAAEMGGSLSARFKANPYRTAWYDHGFRHQLATALTHLSQLTYLHLYYESHAQKLNTSAVAACISKLQKLQVLRLGIHGYQAEDLANLPSSLTALHLYEPPVLKRGSAQLHRLTQLKLLSVSSTPCFDASCVSNLKQLTCLSLVNIGFYDVPAVTQLLSALLSLSNLQLLDLSGCLRKKLEDLQQYAAVAASGQLASLSLVRCCIPCEAYSYIFGFARTALTDLEIGSRLFEVPGSFKGLVAAFPALQQLDVVNCGEGHDSEVIDLEGLHALTSVTSLTSLRLRKIKLTNDALANIAACIQLKKLELKLYSSSYDSPEIKLGLHNSSTSGKPVWYSVTTDGLIHLTQLTGLTQLDFAVDDSSKGLFEQHLVAAGAGSTVHIQLQEAITAWINQH